MTLFYGRLWEVINKMTPDAHTAEVIFRHTVGGLFIQRYVMCGVSDPYTYRIVSDEPDESLHAKLSSIQLVLSKWSYGQLFTEQEHYMMQFNDIIEKCRGVNTELCSTLASGSLAERNRSENAKVTKRIYDSSAPVYEETLVTYNVIAVSDYQRDEF